MQNIPHVHGEHAYFAFENGMKQVLVPESGTVGAGANISKMQLTLRKINELLE
jgi:hypothetical protein